jgi:hypothetical protein
MTIHQVKGTEDNWFFSDGVTREFGENRFVKLIDGSVVMNCVQPLKKYHVDLPVVGEIFNEDQTDS